MPRTTDDILKDALQLTEEERAELACGLLDSLETPPTDERSEAEWISEIEARARAAIAGEPGLEWKAVRADVERRLRRG